MMNTLLPLLLTAMMSFGAPLAADPPCCAGHGDAEHKHVDANEPKSPGEWLDRLEQQAGSLKAFTAKVLYQHFDDLLGRRETRTGNIIYKVDETTRNTSFAVLFERIVVGNRAENRAKHYIFADRWLVEIDHEAKQFIKREVVPPGEELDPLKLGEGPIPLPIRQSREDVEERFEVSLVELPEEPPLNILKNVVGLRLVPKENTPEAKDFERVDVFYDRENGLPLGIIAIEKNGDEKTVRLDSVKHNPQLTDEQLAKISIDEPNPREWAIDVERLRGSN